MSDEKKNDALKVVTPELAAQELKLDTKPVVVPPSRDYGKEMARKVELRKKKHADRK